MLIYFLVGTPVAMRMRYWLNGAVMFLSLWLCIRLFLRPGALRYVD